MQQQNKASENKPKTRIEPLRQSDRDASYLLLKISKKLYRRKRIIAELRKSLGPFDV